MSIRTATAAGKLFLVKQTFANREMLVQFMSVSDSISHAAVVRFHATNLADTAMFSTITTPLSSLIEVDQEAAKAIWLIQTGEEL
jgi:hypothetical protein